MIHRGWGVAAIAALAMAFGTGSAWGADPGIQAGHVGGIVRPFGDAQGSGGVRPALSPAMNSIGRSVVTPEGTPPLLYGGGPVMHAVTTHVIAWAPSGYAFPTGYVSGYEQYLTDLSHDLGLGTNISSVASQYVDATGPSLTSLTNASPITDTNAYPTSGGCTVSGAAVCLMDTQLYTEAANEIAAQHLSSGLNQSYIVLLPPGVDSCYQDSGGQECEAQAFCGYHTVIDAGGTYTTFTLLPYTQSSYSNASGECYDAAVTYPAGTSTDLMALDGIGVHELLESATDPMVGSGYLDVASSEIADECAWYYSPTSSATGGGTYNQLVNGNQYLIQDMWSNQDNSCVQGEASTATVSITPGVAAVSPGSSTLSASLHGDSYAAASYDWSYEDPSGSITSDVAVGNYPSPQLTFSSNGTYTVWVMITDAHGGVVTGVRTVTVEGGPTAAFVWLPSSPATATPVTFNAMASAGTGSVTGYSWDFGDGSTSTAANPAHTYAAAGTYTVTLTVTQSDGLSASAQHSITVTAATTSGGGSGSGGAGSGGSGSGSSGSGGSGGSGSSGSGSGSPSGPGAKPGGTIGQTASTSWLRQELGVRAGQLHIATLLKTDLTSTTITSAKVSGKLVITWYARVKHHKVVVARGAQTVAAGVTAHIAIRLTAAGRALLIKSRSLKISAVGSYAAGSSHITSKRTLTLKR